MAGRGGKVRVTVENHAIGAQHAIALPGFDPACGRHQATVTVIGDRIGDKGDRGVIVALRATGLAHLRQLRGGIVQAAQWQGQRHDSE